MTQDFATAMRRALEKTRAGDPQSATVLLQDMLAGRPAASDATEPCCGPCAEASQKPSAGRTSAGGGRSGRGSWTAPDLSALSGLFGDLPGGGGLPQGINLPQGMGRGTAAHAPVPEGGRVETRQHSSAAGSRTYRLFVPSARGTPPEGVVVMLHGCTQSAEDFALGTRMDFAAEAANFVVAYPEQTGRHNAQSCWNWFRPEDQARGSGEAALLAALGRDLAAEHDCAGRVFVAGLSAGGAMAAILGESHPEVFAAIGVHSGLPAGAARDVPSAFAAMRGDARAGRPASVPAIVFHGTADRTVAPGNADAILPGSGIEQNESGNGRSWTRLVTDDGSELWRVKGGGHTWFGGDPSGSHTDATGPDASAEMLRFFSERGRA